MAVKVCGRIAESAVANDQYLADQAGRGQHTKQPVWAKPAGSGEAGWPKEQQQRVLRNLCWCRPGFKLSPAEGCFGKEKASTFGFNFNSSRVKLKTGGHRQSFSSESEWEQELRQLPGENRRAAAKAQDKSKLEQTHCESEGD